MLDEKTCLVGKDSDDDALGIYLTGVVMIVCVVCVVVIACATLGVVYGAIRALGNYCASLKENVYDNNFAKLPA